MTYDPARHHRRSIRLRDYNYARAGAYFVTLCVQDRHCLFGSVSDGAMHLNNTGHIVDECWQWLAAQYEYVVLDAWVVMPNHMHGIMVLMDDDGVVHGGDDEWRGRGGSRTAPTVPGTPTTPSVPTVPGTPITPSVPTVPGTPTTPSDHAAPPSPPSPNPAKRKPLGRLIGAFKTVSTKRINVLNGTPETRLWQRDFYERIIRHESELNRIRRYIIENPQRWAADRNNPRR